jgi:outer membrane protein OmpA-like peptidoglycan-associated protein
MRFIQLTILFLLFNTYRLSAQIKYNVKSFDAVNSSYNEFGAFKISYDSMLFCSDRPLESLITKKDSAGNYFVKPYIYNVNKSNISRFLPDKLKSDLNVGPLAINSSKNAIIFSQNINSYKKKNINKIPLGIYIIRKVNGKWQQPKPLLVSETYNYTHPNFIDDNTFIFSKAKLNHSNKDIFLAKLNQNDSVIAENEVLVNTSFSEIFPYYDGQSKTLYFSSDRDGNYDVFYTKTDFLNYQPVVKLDTSINTSFDEVSFYIKKNKGYFSRNNSQQNFDIYKFEKQYLVPEKCDSSIDINLCYDFYEASTLFSENDTIPIIYEWDFGDGIKVKSLKTSHCYKKPGFYKISLNAIDTVINQVFFNEANYMLEIPYPKNPSINIADTLTINKLYVINPDTAFTSYNSKNKFYWIIDDYEIKETWYFTHYFETSGHHKLQFVYFNDTIAGSVCKNVFVIDSAEVEMQTKKLKILEADKNSLTLMNMDDEGFILPETYILSNSNDSLINLPMQDSSAVSIQKKQITGKEITIVYNNKKEGIITKDENDRYQYKILTADSNGLNLILIEDDTFLILTTLQDTAFVKESLKGLKSFNDVMQCIVTDDNISQSSLYHKFQTINSNGTTYKVLNINGLEPDSLYTIINCLIQDTISFSIRNINANSIINTEIEKELEKLQNKDSITIKINSLYYDFNKYTIEDYMLNDLQQIVRFLKTNKNYSVQIEAHTDNVGSEKNNIKLSEMRAAKVKEFLINNGIKSDRIKAIGFGSKFQVVPNDTESNRAKNRRVIFKFTK